MKLKKKIKKAYRESNKKVLVVYIVLRTLVLLTFVRQLMLRDYADAFLCLFTLILLIVPFFVEQKFKVSIPSTLEIILLIIIFTATIVGEINNAYVRVPHIDTIMHTVNGFLAAGIGFSLVDILNENIKEIKLSPFFVSIVAFCFSMTVGVLWEFFEFGCDYLLKTDMQKDTFIKEISTVELDETKTNKPIVLDDIKETLVINSEGKEIAKFTGYLDIGIIDTMKDLMVNFLGSLTFSIFGYLYIKNREKYRFANNFILTKQLNVIGKDEENE